MSELQGKILDFCRKWLVSGHNELEEKGIGQNFWRRGRVVTQCRQFNNITLAGARLAFALLARLHCTSGCLPVKSPMKQQTRKTLDVGTFQHSNPVTTWEPEQIRLGGAWAKHEIQHRFDKLCAPYDWVPGWTTLNADQIYAGVQAYYNQDN